MEGYVHIVPDPLWIRYKICTDRSSVHTVKLLSGQSSDRISVQVLCLLQEQVQFWIRNGLKLHRDSMKKCNTCTDPNCTCTDPTAAPVQCERSLNMIQTPYNAIWWFSSMPSRRWIVKYRARVEGARTRKETREAPRKNPFSFSRLARAPHYTYSRYFTPAPGLPGHIRVILLKYHTL